MAKGHAQNIDLYMPLPIPMRSWTDMRMDFMLGMTHNEVNILFLLWLIFFIIWMNLFLSRKVIMQLELQNYFLMKWYDCMELDHNL